MPQNSASLRENSSTSTTHNESPAGEEKDFFNCSTFKKFI
jgi:hypothetical protein